MGKRQTMFFTYYKYGESFESRYMREWAYWTISIFCWIVGLTGLTAMFVFGIVGLSRWDCNNFERNTGIETTHKNMTCYANYNGKWVEKSSIILTIEGEK